MNQKIIDAIIRKADTVCPDSLALIGIYGSVATGDTYAKSDLDLLILIEDDNGYKLCTGFILEDNQVGYDIYCTTLNDLRHDSECHHAYLAKLMDSKIVYIKNQAAYHELCELREKTALFLKSDERFGRVSELIAKAKTAYADASLHDEPGQVRMDAFRAVDCVLNAVMLYHGQYFRYGVKRVFAELSALPVPEELTTTLQSISQADTVLQLRELLRTLLLLSENLTRRTTAKKEPSEELKGTYEEMYSNWRNKVEEAAKQNNSFACFMNMCCLQSMLSCIADAYKTECHDIMAEYNPEHLQENVSLFDKHLQIYEDNYKKANIRINRFADADAFIADYLSE